MVSTGSKTAADTARLFGVHPLRSRVCCPRNALPLISTGFLIMGEDAE